MSKTELTHLAVLEVPLRAVAEEFYRSGRIGGPNRLRSLCKLAIKLHQQGALNLTGETLPAEVLDFLEDVFDHRHAEHMVVMELAHYGVTRTCTGVFDEQIPGTHCPEPS